uniref:Uncharacterized protein n=1 Tax=Polynucleobacter necessarius subsp. necessarius (strain STIR1) TaxID=452638 RepID=B1XUX1_POLNS
MKTAKISALVLAIAGVFTTSANAQSAKANAWEGFYGQVGVGYGMFNPSVSNGTASIPAGVVAPSAVAATTTATNINNISTGLVNLAAGYNFAINSNYVLGLGVAYYPGASSSATSTMNIVAPSGTTFDSGQARYNVKNLYSVTLNPGYVIDNDRLVYAKVGYTGATIGLSTASVPYTITNLTGYTLGLGYKQMVTASIYAFGEVNYAFYGNKTASSTAYGVIPVTTTIKGTGTDFLVGAGYRF